MLSGILLTIPLITTYLVIKFLFNTVDSLFAENINKILGKYLPNYKVFPGIGVAVSIIIIYFIGMLGSSVIIRKLIAIGEKILTKIPFIKEIYTSVKQLVDALSITSSSSSFRKAVYVEYPKENVYVLGFLTNEFKDESDRTICSVFVPTTPNPTSGFILFYPKEDVVPSGKTVDEAFKAIMSGALVFEGKLPLNKKAVEISVAETIEKSIPETTQAYPPE
jgi:uncharacterized membrane protein